MANSKRPGVLVAAASQTPPLSSASWSSTSPGAAGTPSRGGHESAGVAVVTRDEVLDLYETRVDEVGRFRRGGVL